jgi:LEA14-like dessication related protein
MKRNLVFASLLTGLCLVLSAMTLTLSGCASAVNIVNPRYTLRGVTPRVNLAIPPSIDLDLTIGVDNPNPVGIRLDRLDFDFFINNNAVLNSVRSDQGIKIPANGIGDIRLNARIGYDNIRTIWREVSEIIQGNRATYSLRGNAYYNTPVGQLRFPVEVSR